jgi:hypothetical protein
MGLFDFFRKKKVPVPPPAFIEKRLLPRWKIYAGAKIKLQGASDYLACEVRDLNMRGFSLALAEELPPQTSRAELYFNDKYFFDIEIALTWHKQIGAKQVYGARFVKVRDSDREKIYQMMKENFPGCFGKLI